MKKIALLGDSIRLIGYGTVVPQMLGEEYHVYQPEENCRYSKFTLRGVLNDWRKNLVGCDVIHWNNGMWDHCYFEDGVFTTPEEYVVTMLRIARQLKKLSKKVIFATTTPVRDQLPNNDNKTIIAYNNLIVPLLEKEGIIINDLHSLVAQDIEKYIRADDFVHLTEEGIKACGEQVAEMIRKAAADC